MSTIPTPAQRGAATRKRNQTQKRMQERLTRAEVQIKALSDTICSDEPWDGLADLAKSAIRAVDDVLRLVRVTAEVDGAIPISADECDAILDARVALHRIATHPGAYDLDTLTDAETDELNGAHDAERTLAAINDVYASAVGWQDVPEATRDLIAQNID